MQTKKGIYQKTHSHLWNFAGTSKVLRLYLRTNRQFVYTAAHISIVFI